ncbi:tetratricopeptide repeat protein [uncultured Corynebacterium sp.]|uniref:tetratricopeptide repeat protein n=1 Tax=uncultured Corynebacterium sp. TaxID=159447 RepID=UPI0025E35FCE|nr:tetratricopeptide repeat protein [uncultured Corynebacterium sp.]
MSESSDTRGSYNNGRDRDRQDRGGERRPQGNRNAYRGNRDSRDDHRRDDRRGGGYRGGSDRRDDRRGGYGDDRRGGGYRGRSDRRDDRRGGDPRNGSSRNDNGMRPDGRRRDHHNGPQRSGYRESRVNNRFNEPDVPADISPKDLDPAIRQELRSLSKDNADKVAGHLIMAASLMDQDSAKALAHARAAKERGGRVSITRETLGIAAYHAGEWKEALTELRAARRMAGGPGLLAVMADCERGLNHPEKAVELGTSEEAAQLDPEQRAELAIVIAGAHHDLGQTEEALLVLEPETAATDLPEVTALRVTYAYADALAAAGRTDEARTWFTRAGKLDVHGVLDVEDRLNELGE